jgi:hypothetical protein
VTIGDPIREGKLLEVHCGNCQPERHLYLNPEVLCLPKRMPVPEVARHLVCSKCGARNSETHNPFWARPDARVGGVGNYPDFVRKTYRVALRAQMLVFWKEAAELRGGHWELGRAVCVPAASGGSRERYEC